MFNFILGLIIGYLGGMFFPTQIKNGIGHTIQFIKDLFSKMKKD